MMNSISGCAQSAELKSPRSQAAQIPPRDHQDRPLASPALVEVAHAHGIVVHVWTIDDPDEMRELLAKGVDGMFTDRTDLLREVLEQHGVWEGPA